MQLAIFVSCRFPVYQIFVMSKLLGQLNIACCTRQQLFILIFVKFFYYLQDVERRRNHHKYVYSIYLYIWSTTTYRDILQ